MESQHTNSTLAIRTSQRLNQNLRKSYFLPTLIAYYKVNEYVKI